jgi:hypothetical protein
MITIYCSKKVQNFEIGCIFDLNKVLPTVKILTFSRGESIKDELRHSQRLKFRMSGLRSRALKFDFLLFLDHGDLRCKIVSPIGLF